MRKIWLLISLFVILCVGTVKAAYIDEYSEAYTWAYKNWITTMDTMDKANMYWEITRIELSKMISNYAINILKKKPDTSKKCEFSDVSDRLNLQYDSWVVNSCQLWLMWQWITKFRPYDKVTRGEFGTILSRLLWWDKYNGWNPYYKKHVNQLNIRWIMTNVYGLTWNELRGNVMVMLKRSETLWNLKIPSFEELDDVISDKCPSDFDWVYETVTKKWFIIPYKDWYIGYEFWWQEWRLLYLTYRKIDKPCDLLSKSDAIFWWNWHWLSEPLNNVYKAKWNNDSRHTEEIVKKLNCNSLEENKCKNELNNYIYNLIIWVEQQDYFDKVMDNFKKNL